MDIDNTLIQRKPLQSRNFFVRTVCKANGKNGEDIRCIWTTVYQGDLKHGVRDARLKAKENKWPRGDSKAFLQK